MPASDFIAILRTLNECGVEFIVVGGVGAVLQGAPISTFDLDIVHSRSIENVERLLAALRALEAYYRMQPERRLQPDASHLASAGHQLLMTRYGPLDLLGMIGHSHGYESLTTDAIQVEAGADVRVQVLGLERLIAVKTETAGEKDLAALPILRKTLEEQKKRGSKPAF